MRTSLSRLLTWASIMILAGCPPAGPIPTPAGQCVPYTNPEVLSLREETGPVCPGILDAGVLPNAFKQWLTTEALSIPGKRETCKPPYIAFTNLLCGELATVRGSWDGDFGGEPFPDHAPDSLHDGDSGGDVCPNFTGAIPDISLKNHVVPYEIRTDTFGHGQVHLEWQWCRQFAALTGTVSLAEERGADGARLYGPVDYLFAPNRGDQVAAFGDWVMDMTTINSRRLDLDGGGGGGWAELHETWMYATRSGEPGERRLPCETCTDSTDAGAGVAGPEVFGDGGYGHAIDFRVSAQLPVASPQVLWVQAVVPPRPEAEQSLTKFDCRPLEERTLGCPRFDKGVRAAAEGWETIPADGGLVTFSITLPPDSAGREALTSGYFCSNWTCGQCQTRSCFRDLLADAGGTTCDFPRGLGGSPLFAGVFRCNWKDPIDLWSCADCGGDNLAQPGASIRAPVVGCAPLGLDPAQPQDRRRACDAVCGGTVCGDAPACRIGVCRPPTTTADVSARLLARDGCVPPPPFTRVAPMGDYRVDFGVGSTLRFGSVDATGTIESFAEIARTAASGFVYINLGRSEEPAVPSLQIAYLELAGAPFSFTTFRFNPLPVVEVHPVADASAVTLLRARATRQPSGAFEFQPGALLLAARATIDGQPGGAEAVSQGLVTGAFDPVVGTFTLDAVGRNESGQATVLHLVGTVTNRPPVASAGPARNVECGSSTSTAITLEATGSYDPDVGDSITEYQWFKQEMRPEPGDEDGELVPVTFGVGIGPTLTTQASLGEHNYQLHVYDTHLGSGRTDAFIRVVDTTPPVLSLPDPVCLWPPNHEFARFELGVDVPFSVADGCDPHPTVRIVSVTANEAVQAAGSGNTSPDVVFGPTTACVRSERSGSGTGRTYTVVTEARDASGNASRKTFTVTVPHDMSGHPGCTRATGLDNPDLSCSH